MQKYFGVVLQHSDWFKELESQLTNKIQHETQP